MDLLSIINRILLLSARISNAETKLPSDIQYYFAATALLVTISTRVHKTRYKTNNRSDRNENWIHWFRSNRGDTFPEDN